MTTVRGQSLWNDEKSIGEGRDAPFRFALDGFADAF